MAFRAPDGVPVVDLTVGSETVPAVIDSRGSGLALPGSMAARLKLAGEPVILGRGRTVSGEFEIRGVELAQDVLLGGYRFQRPFVVLHPEFPVGNVGGAVLRSFVLTFDQRSKLVHLDAPERTLVLPRPRPRPPPTDGGAPQPGR
ncbi:MAG TPA: aspartyl protease family protein [Myxococcaceae bacterium]